MSKTIFCDIDGTLVSYESRDPFVQLHPNTKLTLLPGVKELLNEWNRKEYNVILTTGRKESARKVTEEQLREIGITYDQLIMGLGGGQRVLINDKKPDSDEDTAIAIVVQRNKGLEGIQI